jgi:hypothetical protein
VITYSGSRSRGIAVLLQDQQYLDEILTAIGFKILGTVVLTVICCSIDCSSEIDNNLI